MTEFFSKTSEVYSRVDKERKKLKNVVLAISLK